MRPNTQHSMNRSHNHIMKKKKRRKRNIFLLLTLIFLSVISITGYFALQTYVAATNSYEVIDGREEKSELREEPVFVSNDPFSVIILGIENYTDENDRGRSDTIMVATFNPEQQTMKLVSIPRDTLVNIPDYKSDKINHSYSIGGKEKVIATVEDFLEVPIDYYVTVNFQGFTNIIDTLGGVKVDVPFDFNDINRDWERFYFYEGVQTLNGDEALVYARMRKQDPRGDFGRNERQRQIVAGVIDKISSPSTFLKIDDIVEVISDNIGTNMRMREALAFIKKYPDFNASSIEQQEIKGYDEYINNIYYFTPDKESVNGLKQTLKEHLELIENTNEIDTSQEITTNQIQS
ncbi:cell envelope-related function transcriptional attenuator common domain-containing protein [Mesobacillus persicus]|uniref:Cell envelope-related function transcriptional attenuator common domain-containing protein n=1 Tax=Mesobacillus persicus TaxID=930146 RepID=A0A1H8A789_9BACI|nr:LCP family protein [Mesobacillus persicus]SEM65407.1 cell envelope-related function transcriptional attenuator common domain-containing protein [Mesobacillus persicus]